MKGFYFVQFIVENENGEIIEIIVRHSNGTDLKIKDINKCLSLTDCVALEIIVSSLIGGEK